MNLIGRKIENRYLDSLGDKPLNILTFPTHERYETQLAKTGHNFYSFHVKNSKKWNREQLPPPSNYHILPEEALCEYINYDLILVQSKYWQYSVAQKLNSVLKLPIVVLEHTLPTPNAIKQEHIDMMRQMRGQGELKHVQLFDIKWDSRFPSTSF